MGGVVMDLSDRATAREEEILQDSLSAVARRPKMPFTGRCYNCDEVIERGSFCDADCRDDFEHRQRLKGRHGAN
jgi:hypothetical protein